VVQTVLAEQEVTAAADPPRELRNRYRGSPLLFAVVSHPEGGTPLLLLLRSYDNLLPSHGPHVSYVYCHLGALAAAAVDIVVADVVVLVVVVVVVVGVDLVVVGLVAVVAVTAGQRDTPL